MIYLVLAVLGLHIISMPIVVGVFVFIDTDRNVGRLKIGLFGIPVFVKKIDITRFTAILTGNAQSAEDRAVEDDEKKEKDDEKIPKPSRLKLFLIDCARRIVTRIRVRNAQLTASVGIGDAAVTAMTVGAVRIAYSQACAFFGFDENSASVTPDYENECIFFDFFDIFSLCFADITVSVCAALLDRIMHKTRRRKYANTVAD